MKNEKKPHHFSGFSGCKSATFILIWPYVGSVQKD
jgi:hypothetical protein